MANRQPRSSQPPERHAGFQCRNCARADFPGRRYSCWICADYHVCGACFDASLLPEAPNHLYYHPLKAHYARAEYQLYFGGEPYLGEDNVAQSYKCALCEELGLTIADLHKHLQETHHAHQDHAAYLNLVQQRSVGGSRTMAEALVASVDSAGREDQRRRAFSVEVVDLPQLLVRLEMLDTAAADFPDRCLEILHRAYLMRAQNSSEDAERVETYVGIIEEEVAASMAERQRRLGRTPGSHRLVRSGVVLPGPNRTAAVGRRPATPSLAARPVLMARRPIMGSGNAHPIGAAGAPQRSGRTAVHTRTILSSSRTPHVDQERACWKFLRPGMMGTRYQQVPVPVKALGCQPTEKIQPVDCASAFSDTRFLCSKLLRGGKSSGDQEQWLKAGFIEALFCSMLADEELIQLPRGLLWTVRNLTAKGGKCSAIESPAESHAINEQSRKPQQPASNEMERFYKGLDQYKAWMSSRNTLMQQPVNRQTVQNWEEASTSTGLQPSAPCFAHLNPGDIPYADSDSDDGESGVHTSGNSSQNERAPGSAGLAEQRDESHPVNRELLDEAAGENGAEDSVELEEDGDDIDEEDEASESDFSETTIAQITDYINMIMQDE
ncbi:uncharacterized protein LOC108093410 [Drosophila ficusphila]|uniref:uncharacterized protein LOC108093410 n=1 Tax=Drosophila ficusphila TaxID=30025 RepID=UPI001C892B50|nr:uncharacterized protein LOC108093410 [Drosophila ficusphila]